MSNMSGRNTAYSPLPQSNSDSDGSSEEELHVSQENRIVNRISKIQNSKTDKAHSEPKQNIINYKPLDNDGDIEVTLIKFQSDSDDIKLLKPNNNVKILSTTRKICFVLSLLLCVFSTVVFIWILPCNVGACLSVKNQSTYISIWDQILNGVELNGPISVIPDTSDTIKNFVFLMKIFSEEQNFDKSGVISLKKDNGMIDWKINITKEAKDIDCSLIDANLDGVNDCLVVGNNFWKVINSLTGSEIWDVQTSNKKDEIYELDFPLVIPDLKENKMKNLLTSCSFSKSDEKTAQNYLVIISGANGEIINHPLKIPLCIEVHNLMFENSSVVSYTCYDSIGKESLQMIGLVNIYESMKNVSEIRLNSFNLGTLHQHKKDIRTTHLNFWKILLENKGQCPENCILSVKIKDEREGDNNKTIFNSTYKNAYGMTPISVKSEKFIGFVIKLWKWHSTGDKFSDKNFNISAQQMHTAPVVDKPLKRNSKLKKSISLDNEMILENESKFQRFKRTALLLKKNISLVDMKDFNFCVATETIATINLINQQPIISNITEEEIIQMCINPNVCQPDYRLFQHSIMAVDLDQDKKQEIITFTSTYVHEKIVAKSKKNWKLQSRVQLIKL